jgi:hypothetical protein
MAPGVGAELLLFMPYDMTVQDKLFQGFKRISTSSSPLYEDTPLDPR